MLGNRWGLDLKPVTTADINDNTAAFTDRTVLLVPDGSSATGGLTAAGQANLRAWVAAGDTYIGLRNEGTRMARAAGLTSTTEKAKPTDYTVIGSHFRVDVDDSSPVALGRPAEDFEFNNERPDPEPEHHRHQRAHVPDRRHLLAQRLHRATPTPLKGTAALVDEPTGAGRAVLFAFNPLFRAYNESGLHLVANALLYPAAASRRARTAAPQADGRPGLGPPRRAAGSRRTSAVSGGPITIQVADADLARTQSVVERYTDTARIGQADGSAYLTIPNPEGLTADEHPFLRDLVQKLRAPASRCARSWADPVPFE